MTNGDETEHISTDILTEVLEVGTDKTGEAMRSHTQAASSAAAEDLKFKKSPQRVGLREKLLRLAPPSEQKDTFCVHKDEPAESQPSVPTLNVEPATESETEGDEEEGGRDKAEIHSKGDDREEVVLPDITGRSCTPVRDSRNSKYHLHCLTAHQKHRLSFP